MTPVTAVLGGYVVLGSTYALAPMDPPADQPRLLDSSQFAAFGIGLALVVALLAVIAVGTWRR